MLKKKDSQMILARALRRSYEVHQGLGAAGEEIVQKNQFGETALRADVEIEGAVLRLLRDEQVPIRVISEEHGRVDIVPKPEFLGILDGLDGSNRYQAGRGVERYGTMFGISKWIDPRYGDYLCAGIMEHSSNTLVISSRDGGTHAIGPDGVSRRLRVSGKTCLDADTRVYLNDYWDASRNYFAPKVHGCIVSDPRSYATYFHDLAAGTVDMVLTYTGKHNLEIAVAYGLVKEAGGDIYDMDARPVGEHGYFDFGHDQHIPIVASCSRALVEDLSRRWWVR